MRPILYFTVLLTIAACSQKTESTTDVKAQAYSFAGKPLYSKLPDAKILAKSDSIISTIKTKQDLTDDDYVEIGKQLVATARYKEAVDLYTEGLQKYPNSYKLLRNRGHRYITLRKLDESIGDLIKAEELSRDEPEVMEYGVDGKPTATVKHQIWYHIGVYHYLKGDYSKSAEAFEKAVATGGDLKNVVGASDWLYNSYQRLGQKENAEKVISAINPEADTDKENPYFRRILLYKKVITPEELSNINKAVDSLTVQDITKIYGLANSYAYAGQKDRAIALYELILKSDAWPGFAYAGAEKDLLQK